MTIIDFEPMGIQRLAEDIAQAQSGIQVILEKLDRDVKAVEPKWGGETRRAFERFYQEWRKGVDAHSRALQKTSMQLKRLVEAHQTLE
jgi:WXG100 family type VII secretion target